MRPESRTYSFGPFRLDSGRRTLFRGPDPVWLTPRSTRALLVLVENAGRLVLKQELTEAVWPDVAVSDNSICQVITELRNKLGPSKNGASYIETKIRKGYLLVARVESGPPPASNRHHPDGHRANRPASMTAEAARALLEPYCALADGRASLETLDLAAIGRARLAFADLVIHEPDCVPAQIVMANACVLLFQSTRADLDPDRAALALAEHHARAACGLDRWSSDAWSTLALVLHCTGTSRESIAAARKAVAIEPENHHHHLRLAFVSWGGVRLRAASRVLALCPGLALAHWLAATVFVARGAFDVAIEHLQAGCASQQAQKAHGHPLPMVGLHLLYAQVHAARGNLSAARDELQRELALEGTDHVYGRERLANTWYALGALALRQNRGEEARAAFQEALRCVPGHALAAVGLAAASGRSSRKSARKPSPSAPGVLNAVDAAVAEAAALALRGRHAQAARVCGDALLQAEAGFSGWILPIEPLLHVAAHRDAWAATLTILRNRAL